jgi:hypothetical protein
MYKASKINRYVLFAILLAIWPFILFPIIYSNQPNIITVDPVSINESFSINDSSNKLIKNIMINNVGSNIINLRASLESGEDIRNTSNDSNIKFANSYIGISLKPNKFLQIKSGDIEFLSVNIDASKMCTQGDYRGAIIINATDEGRPNFIKQLLSLFGFGIDHEVIHEVVPVTLRIKAAKSGNNDSKLSVMDKIGNQTAKLQVQPVTPGPFVIGSGKKSTIYVP